MAERVSGMVRPPDVLRNILCVEGRINRVTLAGAADLVDGALLKLDAALNEVARFVDLSCGEETSVEPHRRSLSALRSNAESAAQSLNDRSVRLSRLIEVIRPEANVSVERLPEDVALIARMRVAIQHRDESEQVLRTNGADIPDNLANGGNEAATWLLNAAGRGEITDLMRAVASDTNQRERVQRVVEELKRTAACGDSWKFLKSIFDINANVSSGITMLDSPVGELARHLLTLRDGTASIGEWLKFSRWQREMDGLGFEQVVSELLAGQYEPREARDIVAVRFYRKLFDYLAEHDQTLGQFEAAEHEGIRERFRQLDQWEIKAAATRIRQYQLGRDDRPRPGWNTPGLSELGILLREALKKRRHMPLRRLFAEIPGVLQRLKPCIMMSPLSVSTFLQSDEIRFDVVIFDEASQVFPWDAIGAVHRGAQLIVAGDEKQLPPTNFFNRGDMESEDEEDDIGDFESILSLCKSINMPSKGLRWHYRSRREPLIAFSNRHFYGGDLVTFPSVRDVSNDAVRLELVQGGRWVDRKNIAEAERIADLVIAHHRKSPQRSLGVIAFNATQQQTIEDAIFQCRRADPEVDALLNTGLAEPLFIKNLETVQGDERDVILLSMGYAFNEAGKFLKNFGPLTKTGGERRLNVAITRARQEVVLVASVRSADIDLSDSKSKGSHLLKAYLEYAESGVDSLARRIDSISGDCESPFETEVATALVQNGLDPVAQVGCGGFRIDLALRHPSRPGEFCLGIECDGATYHSSKTARDRDRIRQSVLEGLGWRMVRIWSTEWVRDPTRQLERILAAYESAAASTPPLECQPASETDDLNDDPDNELQPRYVNHTQVVGPSFGNIADVPDETIRASAKNIVVRAGATDWDDLIKLVTRELGFARTGKKIRERLEAVLHDELRIGSLRRIGDRITSASTAMP